MLGRSSLDAGDDEADIEALCGGLDPGTGTAIGLPGFRPVACFGEAAQAGLLVERAAGADVVCQRIDQPDDDTAVGQAQDQADSHLVTPFHDHGATTNAVDPECDFDPRS